MLAGRKTIPVLLATTPGWAQTVYTEDFVFPNGTGSTTIQGLSAAYGTTSTNELSQGWGGFSGATAIDQTGSVGTQTFAISDRQSPNGPSSGAKQYGIVIDNFDGLSMLATTPTGLSISTSDQNLTFKWIQGDNAASVSARFAIKLDNGQWYASATSYSTAAPSASSFASLTSSGEAKSLIFSTSAANWILLNFAPGTQLVLGIQPTANLSGHIVGLGF